MAALEHTKAEFAHRWTIFASREEFPFRDDAQRDVKILVFAP
jgi:hypothetical protein